MKLYLFLLTLLVPFIIIGNPIDTIEAKQIAINFFQYKNPNKSWVGIKQTKIKNYKGITTRYIFIMGNNSFVIVSADNSVVPILAYSDNGTFNEDYFHHLLIIGCKQNMMN